MRLPPQLLALVEPTGVRLTDLVGSMKLPKQTLGDSGEGAAPWNLRLYIAGDSPKSRTALANLQHLCDTYLDGKYAIEATGLNVYYGNFRAVKDMELKMVV